MTKQPQWQPIENLPLIAYVIDGTVASADETYDHLQQARQTPYSLDDATVHRTIRLFTDQKNGLWEFDEQLRRWKTQQLSSKERKEIARLERQMQKLHEITAATLAVAKELQAYTIETLLAKSDVDVGLAYVVGKPHEPTTCPPKTDQHRMKKGAIFYLFFFPIKLALYDQPDGTVLSHLRFDVTFPILPSQYASLEKSIGSLDTAETLYRDILAMMVLQTIERDYPEAVHFLFTRHPAYPDAEIQVQINGTMTRSGEACMIREEMQVGEMFRLQIP